MTLTTDRSYFAALKPRITFKSLDGTDTYFTFNGHGSPKDINITYADMSNSIGETGDFNIIVEDSSNIINRDHLRNTKVYIELGKTEAALQHFLIGFADIFDVSRPRTNYQEYRISGFGTQIQADEFLLLIRKSSQKDDGDSAVKRLFQRPLEERKFRPMNKVNIGDLVNWSTNIASNLNTKITQLNEVFTTLRDFYDRLAALEGCDWYIDYSTGTEILTAKHPLFSHNGIHIKSGDLRTPSDNADKISYIKSQFSVTDDSSSNAGIKTQLYTTQIIEQKPVSENLTNKGRTTLNKRFVAQQVNLLNDERRITDLEFIMERIGEPESPKSRVNGFIILDNDDKPTGRILGTFNIDLSSLKRATETIQVNDVDIKSRFIEGGAKIWLAFTDRSGINGNVEDDPDNTVAWHHDGTVGTAHTAGSYSAIANISDDSDREDPAGADWQVSTNGPVYNYRVLSSIRRLLARNNQTAIRTLRTKEAFIDSSFLSDTTSVNKFLALNLNPISKVRRTINNVTVSIPNNFIFRPYTMTSFSDGLSGVSQDFQIVSVSYIISALPGDPQYGTYDCDLTLNSSFNPLVGSCTCV